MEEDRLQSLTDRCKWRARIVKPSTPTIGFDDTKIGMLIDGEPHINTRVPHIHCGSFRFPIDVKTLGQYTGYNDKYGKEIYEGDIVRLHNNDKYIFAITYDKERGFLIDSPTKNISLALGACIINSEIEVIGNIYDNKDLLK